MSIEQLPIYSVSQLNRQIRGWLENEIGLIRVEGEVSNLTKPTSGHFYFTLKDSGAQLRCVYFRNRHTSITRTVENGQQVVLGGVLSVYEARGDYQLIVNELSEKGLGDLYQKFNELKAKLAQAGLFDPAQKKILPRFPGRIGVVTSASGAALRDILITLARRYPVAIVRVYHSDVQGKYAAGQLANAIRQANQDACSDVLILARGGGSIEDLWAFNDEQLAYAIFNSAIPIVSGIGHETDFTIADFVADVRAATPTAAAETVTPDQAELHAYFAMMKQRLLVMVMRLLQHKKLLLSHLTKNMISPKRLMVTQWQTLDYLERRLLAAMTRAQAEKAHRLSLLFGRLQTNHPRLLCLKSRTQIQRLYEALWQHMTMKLFRMKQELRNKQAMLHAVSPLATLDRGYSIASHQGKVLTDSQRVQIGDNIQVRLARGMLTCTVCKSE